MALAVCVLVLVVAGCGDPAGPGGVQGSASADEFVGTWQDAEAFDEGHELRVVITRAPDGYRADLVDTDDGGTTWRDTFWMNLTRDGDRLSGQVPVTPGGGTLGWSFRLDPSTGHLAFVQKNNGHWNLKIGFDRLDSSTDLPLP